MRKYAVVHPIIPPPDFPTDQYQGRRSVVISGDGEPMMTICRCLRSVDIFLVLNTIPNNAGFKEAKTASSFVFRERGNRV